MWRKYISIKDLAQLSDCSNEVIYHLIANRQLTLHPSDYLSAEARVYTAEILMELVSKFSPIILM